MPLQIQVIDGSVNGNPVYLTNAAGIPAQYDSGALASAEVATRRRIEAEESTRRFRIVKVEAADSNLANKEWRSRELGRFHSGYYDHVPWANESWYKESDYAALHHCHMSRDKTAMVAFTESEDKGRDDKQKRMRPGRYLTQYFESAGLIDDIEVRYWAGKLSIQVGGESDLLHFATSPDDIEDTYINGPHSCMAHDPDHYHGPIHPTRVYGAGDLAVAFIERESSIAARALTYPAHKVYSTVYGDGGVWTQQLKDLLEGAGYEFSSDHGDWDGARLLRVEHGHGNFVIPYFDIPGDATDDGDYLRVQWCGEIETATEHGVSEDGGRACDNCSERYDDENGGGFIESTDQHLCDSCYSEIAFYCDDCDRTGVAEDSCYIEGIDRHICDSCADDYPSCDDCHERHKADSVHTIEAQGERTVCESCYEDSYMLCGECSESDRSDSFIERIDGESICKSCAESMVQCIECDKHDDSDSCYVDSDGDSWCGDCRQSCLEFTDKEESE